MPFPLIKLGTMMIRQIGKPVSRFLKEKAKTSDFFKKRVCMPPAQFYHWLDTSLKLRLMGLGKPKDVKPLNEQNAIDLGADLLGEFIIFSVASGTLYFEYWRQSRNAQLKEDVQNDSIKDMTGKINELGIMLEDQDAKIRELTRLVHSMHGSQKSLPQKIVSAVTGS